LRRYELPRHVAALPIPPLPFSRKVRLLLSEKGIAHELVRESPWLRRDEFVDLNPACETPVLVEAQKGTVLIDSGAISEYFEETVEKAPMIPGTAVDRAEIRRLVAGSTRNSSARWSALLEERMRKRIVSRRPPDTKVLRERHARRKRPLDYIDYLLDHRRWLAGPALTLADLTAAAHLSVADYLGGARLARAQADDGLVCRDEVAAELPPFAGRAHGGDRPTTPLRQGRLLLAKAPGAGERLHSNRVPARGAADCRAARREATGPKGADSSCAFSRGRNEIVERPVVGKREARSGSKLRPVTSITSSPASLMSAQSSSGVRNFCQS
jgi:glutathione S-transferase